MTKKIDFAKYSSMRVGGVFDVKIIQKCSDFDEQYYILGSCNNILMGTNPPPLAMLSKEFDYIKIKENMLLVGGATPSGKIASFCKKHNIGGFEFLSHLPGKLGGLIKMNAGLKEFEIFNNLISVSTCKGVLKKRDITYGYRFADISSPVIEASFEISCGFRSDMVEMFKKMRSNQPKLSSAGSCFKNPKGDFAGRLIEAVGLKGFRVNDMEFSTKHANFLVNHGNGKFEDALFLIEEAKKRVYEKFGISLECEIAILNQ